jgi:hypothetical protein
MVYAKEEIREVSENGYRDRNHTGSNPVLTTKIINLFFISNIICIFVIWI